MLKEYLEKTYGYNEPIFISEIQLDGMNDNALRQYFKRMLKSGDMARFDTGNLLSSKGITAIETELFRPYESHYPQIYNKFKGNLWILFRCYVCQPTWLNYSDAGCFGNCNVKRIKQRADCYDRLPNTSSEAPCHRDYIPKCRTAPIPGYSRTKLRSILNIQKQKPSHC